METKFLGRISSLKNFETHKVLMLEDNYNIVNEHGSRVHMATEPVAGKVVFGWQTSLWRVNEPVANESCVSSCPVRILRRGN